MKQVCIIIAVIIGMNNLMAEDNRNILIDKIGQQLLKKDELFAGRYPEYTENGRWKYRKNVNWFSGFIAGELWHFYHITRDSIYYRHALKNSEAMLPFAAIDYTHDMGFIFLPSCVQAYKITGRKKYRSAALKAAEMLAKRYNANGYFIRAWGKLGSPEKAGWMIIDTMMNLELLFWAAKESGNRFYYDIAYRHALTTLRESVRDDGSSFHVIEFDPRTGKALKKRTHQGAGDSTTWARGQAWGVYGFANAYRHTKNKKFLITAQKMADYMIARLPDDFVPYWDLDLSGQEIVRDASAAAVLASGLYLLADQCLFKQRREGYLSYADRIVESLLQNYLFLHSGRSVEQGLLIHTVYNHNKKWGVDESYPAGDYYFVEALRKYWDKKQTERQIKNNGGRQILNLNKNWYYLEDAEKDVNQLSKSPAQWQFIQLPHTWNRFDATDNLPGYRRSASWYEKRIFVPELNEGQHLLLSFEGVNIECDVYVNGKRAGGHIGGYVGFDVDISDYIVRNSWNTIRIRVDNSYNPNVIPSQKSDFFIFGGIVRDVWLKILPAAYIGRARIQTPFVSKEKAQVVMVLDLEGNKNIEQGQIEVNIVAPDGKKVLTRNYAVQNTDKDGNLKLKLPPIDAPLLWSPETPLLYTAEISLREGGVITDRVNEKFGLRWFRFAEHGPFYLNGERLLLRGTHRHEEHAGYGAAMPNALHRRDMEQIKKMGANFVRLAHYPQDPEVYRACDSLGILVWDELPWCRGGMGGRDWKQNTRRLLKEQINGNFNHPCIIIRSLGNELYWLPDFPGGANDDSLRVFLRELNELSHRLDPGRLTALRKYYAGADIVDVFSPSIWAGWYSGIYKNYEKALAGSRKKYKHFFHAEYGGASHLGRHEENPISGEGLTNPDGWEEAVTQVKVKNIARTGNWNENYIVDLFDWYLHVSEQSDWLSGNAQWAFKDFATPLRPENPIPYINQKGLVDRAGFPKDAYYVFKSYWTKSPAFCYIESHTWRERIGPEGKKRTVCIYSNCSRVELFLNGKSQGIKERNIQLFPASGLSWDVLFAKGKNRLLAKGFNGTALAAADTLDLVYHYDKYGKADKIKLTARRLKNGNYLIEAVLQDENGRRILDYNKRIYFSYDGDGYLLKDYGTATRSEIIEMANGYAAIEFVPVPGGRAVIEARNQDFKGSYLIVDDKNEVKR